MLCEILASRELSVPRISNVVLVIGLEPCVRCHLKKLTFVAMMLECEGMNSLTF